VQQGKEVPQSISTIQAADSINYIVLNYRYILYIGTDTDTLYLYVGARGHMDPDDITTPAANCVLSVNDLHATVSEDTLASFYLTDQYILVLGSHLSYCIVLGLELRANLLPLSRK